MKTSEEYKRLTLEFPYKPKVEEFVRKSHSSQKDIAGKPYYQHPYRVAMRTKVELSKFIEIYEKNGNKFISWEKPYLQDLVYHLALCHDLIEDTNIDDDTLKNLGYTDEFIFILKEYLTHQRNIPYKQYINHISQNLPATIVKMADLVDNLDISRLEGKKLTDFDFKRIQKYLDAYHFLLNSLQDHIEII